MWTFKTIEAHFPTGLESVKQQFLAIKAKVDTVVRQNVSLKGERFGAALLGNPGTGNAVYIEAPIHCD